MFCEKCGAELQGTATVCPECGDRVAVRKQYEIYNELKKKPMEIMARSFKRPLFIIFAALISLFTIASIAGLVKEVIFFNDTSIISLIVTLVLLAIPAICGIVTTVGVWKCVANKGVPKGQDIILIRPLMTCEKVFGIIYAIPGFLVVIASALAAFLAPTLIKLIQDNLSSIPEEVRGTLEDLATRADEIVTQWGNLYTVILLAFAVLLAFLLILNIIVFSKSAEHWTVLKKAAKKGEYVAPAKVPFISLLIYGVLWMAPAAGILFLGISITAIAEVMLGLAIFVEALYFKSLHKAEREIITEIAQEKALLTSLIHQAEAEERKLKENQREASQTLLDELAKANQERQLMTDAQMQQMMQMMMANMMVNQANQNQQAKPQDQAEVPAIEADSATAPAETGTDETTAQENTDPGASEEATPAEAEAPEETDAVDSTSEDAPVEETEAADNTSEDAPAEETEAADVASEDAPAEEAATEETPADPAPETDSHQGE
ncbi:MAG: zinc ribbon domain-containing protein [Clostridia bacterium]|nr:zinc ribbon domain-containing protein [Clostridia bacterium]